MGSMFSAPPVPTYSPVQYVAPSAVTQNNTASNDADNTQQNTQEEDAVKDIIRKTTRGRSSLIQTSYRGVLGEGNALVPQRKNLLGE